MAPMESLSPVGKLVQVFAILVSSVIALAVGCVLADGTSVIKVKDVFHLKRITAYNMKSEGFDHRIDELLGPTYGIGLHHDQSGRTWTEAGAGKTLKQLIADLSLPVVSAALPRVVMTDALKHPVPLLGCYDLQAAGLCAMSFGFIAEVVAVVMIIFHSLVLAGLVPSDLATKLAGLVWLVMSSGFLIVVLLGTGIYTATWECDQPIIPSIKISDHFDYNYGFAFACIGYVSAVLMFTITLATASASKVSFSSSSTNGDASAGFKAADLKGLLVKITLGLTVGVVLGTSGVLVVLGSNGVFDGKAPADPTVNPCEGQKPKFSGVGDDYFNEVKCMKDSVVQVLEQAAANVTRGYKGGLDAADRVPILEHYDQTDLCPVNVHWHLGAEHLSMGEFDGHGTGPNATEEYGSGDYPGAAPHYADESDGRRLATGPVRLGNRCHHYKKSDPKFTTPYNWQYCDSSMIVGETYEIHWPHSAAGACGTPYQYQTPFYDGVFCRDGIITIAPLNTYEKIGVQGQVFTIVNDESYYYPDLFKGMKIDGFAGRDIAKYTGSTTGTKRDNTDCSRYTPITWQVDRKCHMISASSFDKMCADMMTQADDMSHDLYAHGARHVTAHHLTANNQQTRV